MSREVSHYVVTASPPGGVLHSVKCHFLSQDQEDVVIAKSRRLEVRQLKPEEESPFPVVFSCPINGRITGMLPLDSRNHRNATTDTTLLFLITDQYNYALIGYKSSPLEASSPQHSIHTYASGNFRENWNVHGSLCECGPLLATDPYQRCIALHLWDGIITIFPIDKTTNNNILLRTNKVFHARIEERTLLQLCFLHHPSTATTAATTTETPPHLVILHQDSRMAQHIVTHVVDLAQEQMISKTSKPGSNNNSTTTAATMTPTFEWLQKSRIDGGSALMIPIPPSTTATTTSQHSGGVVLLGQRQITYLAMGVHKVLPIPPALLLSWEALPTTTVTATDTDTATTTDENSSETMPRFLLGDEGGNLHLLTLVMVGGGGGGKVLALQLDTLGSCATLPQSLVYLQDGLVFCGSTLGDSLLVQIHDEPLPMLQQQLQQQLPEGASVEQGALEEVDAHSSSMMQETTYLSVVEEYTHLGPIVDFTLVEHQQQQQSSGHGVPTSEQQQQQQQEQQPQQQQVRDAAQHLNPEGQQQAQVVVTASGSSTSGSLRIIRNGIGMKEYASVQLGGISGMWSLRQTFSDTQDKYLVQSFVGETRVLGVQATTSAGMEELQEDVMDCGDGNNDDEENEEDDDVGGTLEEVFLPGLESNASTLFVTNVVGDLLLQITEHQVRLIQAALGEVLDTMEPESPMTVASANEAGQIVVALQGGKVLHIEVSPDQKLKELASKQMDREVSCLNIHPFASEKSVVKADFTSQANAGTNKATMCAVGLWDDFTVRLLSLQQNLKQLLMIHLSTEEDEDPSKGKRRNNRNNMMARSLCLITLDFSSSNTNSSHTSGAPGVNMLFVGLGDGTLVSFPVVRTSSSVRVQSKKEVSLGTQRITLVPLHNEKGGTCVLATGDRPTVIYLTGASTAKNYNPKLCYSNVNLSPADDIDQNDVSRPHAHESIAVNVAAPFFSPLLFDSMGQEHYSLCVADDSNLRLGVIDDIQKLHITTCRLGMAPRRIVHCPEGRLFAVGCIESGIHQMGVVGRETAMGNCIRFLDDSTFEDIERIDLEPCEMVLSMESVSLRESKPTPSASRDSSSSESMEDASDAASETKSYMVIGTAYALHDEDEPTKGRIMVMQCSPGEDGGGARSKSSIHKVTELQVHGGVYSMCQFYDGRMLATVNSKTLMFRLVNEGTGVVKLSMAGTGHHGHILSLFVNSRATKNSISSLSSSVDSPKVANMDSAFESSKEKASEGGGEEKLAVVGDLMRSISLVQYYPEHDTLEEVARDFHANWTTAVAMLTDDVYIGGENWNNLFVLRRNTKAQSEEVRCRLDTVGEFHLGEMCNKFMTGSLVMPSSTSGSESTKSSSRTSRRALASPTKKGDSSGKPAASFPPGSPGVGSTMMSAARSHRPVVSIGSQTLFGTVDGTLGVILGLDGPTTAFFLCLERAMEKALVPVGNFSHQQFRAFVADQRLRPSHGFVDGDLVESFLDLETSMMEAVVQQMNKDGGWESDESAFLGASGEKKGDGDVVRMEEDSRPELSVDDVLAVVEEMSMFH